MAPPTPSKSRFRNFLARIFPFLTRRQQRIITKSAVESKLTTPPASGPRAAPPPTPAAPAPPPAAPATATATEKEMLEREQRIEELRRTERDARREREALEVKNVAQDVPTHPLEEFQREPGFKYNTWFKAVGSFGEAWDGVDGDSPHLMQENDDYASEYGVDAAFTSRSKLGKVRWNGEVSRETVLDELNTTAFGGDDFRDIYPTWEYRYFLTKQIGNVVVGMFEHKARQPIGPKDRAMGYHSS
jgi:hypothetical protein